MKFMCITLQHHKHKQKRYDMLVFPTHLNINEIKREVIIINVIRITNIWVNSLFIISF